MPKEFVPLMGSPGKRAPEILSRAPSPGHSNRSHFPNSMKSPSLLLAFALVCPSLLFGADTPAPATAATSAKPALKITPGKIIIPTDRMQRPWGELISLDLATRTGTFRRESNDEVVNFTVMPYAELLHHATLGDLQDFRVGERAIFRLHENDKGEWVLLTYIQDEMNMMNNHKEYFYVDAIDPAAGKLTCMWANFDKSFVREKSVTIETDKDTRYWKGGQPAKFSDIQIGDKLRTKTHGIGHGKTRMAWDVFLDDESLQKFQTEQKAVHAQRMRDEGLPGYVDTANDGTIELTLFPEGRDFFARLKPGATVRTAPAGADRKPSTTPVEATIATANSSKLTLKIPAASTATFRPTELARVWVASN